MRLQSGEVYQGVIELNPSFATAQVVRSGSLSGSYRTEPQPGFDVDFWGVKSIRELSN